MDTTIILAVIILSLAMLSGLRRYYKSRERRSMIEKGLDPSLVNIYDDKSNKKVFLFAGIFLLGLAIGIITGIVLAGLLKLPGETKELILLSVIISMGISSFICYRLSGD